MLPLLLSTMPPLPLIFESGGAVAEVKSGGVGGGGALGAQMGWLRVNPNALPPTPPPPTPTPITGVACTSGGNAACAHSVKVFVKAVHDELGELLPPEATLQIVGADHRKKLDSPFAAPEEHQADASTP